MSYRLRSNIAANMIGRLASTGLAVVFTPVYIHLLGIEAYGLIGFYTVLQAGLSFLELGLSYTCNRELAKHSAQGSSAFPIMLDILRSLEVIYWAIALLIGLLLMFFAHLIASAWLDSKIFSVADLESIIIIMAWVIALRWPVALYQGALNGLQKQLPLNLVLVIVAILNWGGAALILWLFDASIDVFFLWQCLVSVISVILFLSLAWFCMPGKFFQGKFSWLLLMRLFPFTMAVGANAILGTILSQADKLIVSAIMPLKVFAYYALASMIAESIILLATPISSAIFPRMAQMVGQKTEKKVLVIFFHLSAQSLSIFIIPLGLILIVFSYDVLLVYTGSEEITRNTALTLSIMALAKIFHANMLIPYGLLMSLGKLKLSVYLNIASVFCFLPLVVLLSQNFGLPGAAGSWLLITVGYVFIGMPMILKLCFNGEWMKWVSRNLMVPFLLLIPMLFAIKELLSQYALTHWEYGILLTGIGFFTTAIIVMILPEIRKTLKSIWINRSIQ